MENWGSWIRTVENDAMALEQKGRDKESGVNIPTKPGVGHEIEVFKMNL